MIGASKLTEEDVIQIKKLLNESSLTLQEIADIFGVSRPMISAIKLGLRWNDNSRSFTMKKKYTRTITLIKDKEYSTGISPIQTINGDKFALVHYINNVENSLVGFYDEEPTYDELRVVHNGFVKTQI